MILLLTLEILKEFKEKGERKAIPVKKERKAIPVKREKKVILVQMAEELPI